MAKLNEVYEHNLKTIRELSLGTIFRYNLQWYIRSTSFVDLSDNVSRYRPYSCVNDHVSGVYYLAVRLDTGYPELEDHRYGCSYPERIAESIDIKVEN